MKAPSIKELQIEKTSQRMLVYLSIASFLLVFTIFSAKSLIVKMNYQNRVIDTKNGAYEQIKKNLSNTDQLVSAYNQFNSSPVNLIGGDSFGNAVNSGNNSKIILDALPSEYDFPALASSLNYLLTSSKVSVDSLTGTDQSTTSSSTGTTSVIPIPFTFSVKGPILNIHNVFDTFQKSIRPFQFLTINLSGSSSDLSLSATAQSYYAPAIKYNTTTQVQQ